MTKLNKMQALDLVQGSDAWLEARLNYLCASEAPAMMGKSKFMSRKELLDLKKGWKNNPDSSFKQKLFSGGHEAEDSARQHVEFNVCEDLPATVGLIVVDGLEIPLLASFDGRGDFGYAWEHKLWNATLSENVLNGVLEDMYWIQLEHQMIVNDYDDSIHFTCSDGGEINKVDMMYRSVPERRAEVLAGWKQFIIDLDAHEIEAKAEKAVAVKTALPSLEIVVAGTEITTNLRSVIDNVSALANKEIERKLETEMDFANKDALNKSVTKLRAALKAKIQSVKTEFVTYSEFEEMAKELDSVLLKMESAGKKQVKDEKERKKSDIANNAQAQINDLVASSNAKIAPLRLENVIGVTQPDFMALMKGKSSIKNIQDDIDAEVAKQKIFISETMIKLVDNQAYLKENAQEYRQLFSDVATFINQDAEPFQAIVKTRIAEEVKRQADLVESIRLEEKAKAEKKAKDDLDRMLADEILAHHINNNMVIDAQEESEPDVSETIIPSNTTIGAYKTGTNKVKQTDLSLPMTGDIEDAEFVDPNAEEGTVILQVSIPVSKVAEFKLFIQNNFSHSFYEDSDDISIY